MSEASLNVPWHREQNIKKAEAVQKQDAGTPGEFKCLPISRTHVL